MGRDGTHAREISFVSLVAYGPKVSDSALTMGVTASETRQGDSQQVMCICTFGCAETVKKESTSS